MYVRKRKNKSGSYSVMLFVGERLPGMKHPISRMIKSFGVATNEQHLEQLFGEAEAYKKQLQLSSPKAKTLKISSDLDIRSCRSYNVGFADV